MAGPEENSTPDPAADAARPGPANTGDTDRARVQQQYVAAGASSGSASQQNNGAFDDLTESDSESDTGSGWTAKRPAGDGKPAPGAGATATADGPANDDPVSAVDAAAKNVISARPAGKNSEAQIPDDAASSPASSNPAPSSSTATATPAATADAPDAVDTAVPVIPGSTAAPMDVDAAAAGATDTAASEPEPTKRKPQIGLQRVRKKASPAEQAAFQASLEDQDQPPQSSSSPSEVVVVVSQTAATEPAARQSPAQSPRVTVKVTPRPRSKEYLRTIKMEKEEAAAAAVGHPSNSTASTKTREKYLADRALKSKFFNEIKVGSKIRVVANTRKGHHDVTSKNPELEGSEAIVMSVPIYPSTWLAVRTVNDGKLLKCRTSQIRTIPGESGTASNVDLDYTALQTSSPRSSGQAKKKKTAPKLPKSEKAKVVEIVDAATWDAESSHNKMTAKPVLAESPGGTMRPAAARRESARQRQAAAAALSEFSSSTTRRPKRVASDEDYGPPSKMTKVLSVVVEEGSGHAVRPMLPSKQGGKPRADYMHSSSGARGSRSPKLKKNPPIRSKSTGMSSPQHQYSGRPLAGSPNAKLIHWSSGGPQNDASSLEQAGEHHAQELTMSGGWEMPAGMEAPITYMTPSEQDSYIMVDAVTGLPQTHLSPVSSNYFTYGPSAIAVNPPQQYMPGSPQQQSMMMAAGMPGMHMGSQGIAGAGFPVASNYAEMMTGYGAAAPGYYNFSHIPQQQQQVSPSRQKTSPGFK